jgi:hypothetical protein
MRLRIGNSLYEQYLNSENDEDFELFRLSRNKVNYLRRKAKKLYYEQKLFENHGNIKGT